ncbi:hypothetical protein [Schlesneria sp. DSM 10557]|uniref:hypothetical protein n=1 Tax=Schlesneria sp. DSM 10557 TaxID=3044399 RepID=UPI0035A18A4E
MGPYTVKLDLPLLTKELIEQSARKRTYILRALFALLLYGMTIWIFQRQQGGWNGLNILGEGRKIFISLGFLQFVAIYLFLPAMTCGVLTAEKERDTLGLLLLTRLGPWTIIFEKLFSRLVPIASFMMLSLPLLGIGYSLGGVEATDIVKLTWVLIATALQVGAFSILCSAWFRTTASSFLAAYLLGALCIAGSAALYESLYRPAFEMLTLPLLSDEAHTWLFERGSTFPSGVVLAFGPAIVNGNELIAAEAGRFRNLRQQTVLDCFVMTLPTLGTAAFSIAFARLVLWRRAFVRANNLLLKTFKGLDRFFDKANNNRLTKGVVLVRETVGLPYYDPIRWRETSKRSLGTTRYRFRMLILIQAPITFLLLWPTNDHSIYSRFAPAYIATWILWIVAALVISIQATGLIGSERSHQSLDVLLTTPLKSEEIVKQKFAGIWRTIQMLWIPFATVYAFQLWWESWVRTSIYHPRVSSETAILFTAIRAILSVTLYLPTIAWFGFHQGLRRRSQTQAILITMTVISLVCTLPPLIAWALFPEPVPPFWVTAIQFISPAVVLCDVPDTPGHWIFLLLHFLGVGFLYLWLANRSLGIFAKNVGRNDGSDFDEIEADVPSPWSDSPLLRQRRERIGTRLEDDLNSAEVH